MKDSGFNPNTIVLVAFLFLMLFMCKFCIDSDSENYEFKKVDAYIKCKEFVGLRLKSPRTAQFAKMHESEIYEIAGVFFIKTWVDSENSFGALIRTNCECQLRYNSKTKQVELIQINL